MLSVILTGLHQIIRSVFLLVWTETLSLSLELVKQNAANIQGIACIFVFYVGKVFQGIACIFVFYVGKVCLCAV